MISGGMGRSIFKYEPWYFIDFSTKTHRFSENKHEQNNNLQLLEVQWALLPCWVSQSNLPPRHPQFPEQSCRDSETFRPLLRLDPVWLKLKKIKNHSRWDPYNRCKWSFFAPTNMAMILGVTCRISNFHMVLKKWSSVFFRGKNSTMCMSLYQLGGP